MVFNIPFGIVKLDDHTKDPPYINFKFLIIEIIYLVSSN